MASITRRQMDLLTCGSTVASDAFVEIVPAPGVELVPVEGDALGVVTRRHDASASTPCSAASTARRSIAPPFRDAERRSPLLR